MSKKTGIERVYPLAASASGVRLAPNADCNERTMRSAAPLSIMQRPITAAKAMTMPMLPAVRPNASATRVVRSGSGPGESTLTRKAAVINDRKAFTRRTRIMPTTTAMPIEQDEQRAHGRTGSTRVTLTSRRSLTMPQRSLPAPGVRSQAMPCPKLATGTTFTSSSVEPSSGSRIA